jgi:hypothetical protein
VDHGHTDVSLWFLLSADRTQPLVLDTAEFRSARWWSPTDISGADPATFDPHFARFLAKVGRVRTRFELRQPVGLRRELR